jgi:VanZ family protein
LQTPSQSVLAPWLPPLLWFVVIFLLSGESFSGTVTGTWMSTSLGWLLGDLDPDAVNVLNFWVRKTAHVAAYAVLSLLLFRALRGPRRPGRPGWRLRWAVLAVALSLATATADEVRQSLLPERSGSAQDVLLDLGAAAAMQLGIYLWWLRRRAALAEQPATLEPGEEAPA